MSEDNGTPENNSEPKDLKEDFLNASHKRNNNMDNSTSEPLCKVQKLDVIEFKFNPNLTTPKFNKEFNTSWKTNSPWKSESIELLNDPFQICVLENFLNNSKVIEELVNEMSDSKWTRKKMDLYEFNQATINQYDTKFKYLSHFYDFLKKNVMPWMSNLTGIKLNSVSASCSMYTAGDYLSVHDDLLSNRKIAFVFYVTPWDDVAEWNESMGGALELFARDENGLPKFPIVKQIFPKNNQFVFFHVNNKSFHQVAEVTSIDFPRLTINGWFHGSRNTEPEKRVCLSQNYKPPHNEDIITSEWINECYLDVITKKQIQHQIETSSEISLEGFLISDFFNVVLSELKTNQSLKWNIEGPANQKYYESLDINNLRGPLNDIFKLFSSDEFFKLLFEYTELDLYGKNKKQPKCEISLQKWKPGCYTILGDPSEYSESSLDVIIYFNARDGVGVITYLLPEEEITQNSNRNSSSDDESDGCDSVLLTLYPKNNVLNLVYRSEGTARFTKYVSKAFTDTDEHVYILVCNYKE